MIDRVFWVCSLEVGLVLKSVRGDDIFMFPQEKVWFFLGGDINPSDYYFAAYSLRSVLCCNSILVITASQPGGYF